MHIVILLNHPAHYHMLKNSIQNFYNSEFEVDIWIRNKDVLEELLIDDDIDYRRIANPINHNDRKNALSIIYNGLKDIFLKNIQLIKTYRYNIPDVFIGTDPSISQVSKLLDTKSIIFNEDDYSINKEFCLSTYPFSSHVLSPSVCDIGIQHHKKVEYEGYQKLAYLHPNYFNPNLDTVKQYVPNNENYFIIRLVDLSAIHDIHFSNKTLSNKISTKLVNILNKKGKVLIFAEKKLPRNLRKYQINLENKSHIFDLIYFSDLFVSDSQSMSVESAMLGTPNIRFNNFIGKISVLEELENKYGLTIGIPRDRPDELYKKCIQIISDNQSNSKWSKRRDKMLSEKIDVTKFFTNFIKSINN